VSYCSADESLAMVIEPLRPALAPLQPFEAYAPSRDDTGARYPKPNQQGPEVMDRAALGAAGKLFVPQHSGIQPLPQERAALGYPAAGPACDQQVGSIDAALVGLDGGFVADFPLDARQAPSSGPGCPNHWIVNEGRQEQRVGAVKTPPQLTGYQTTNRVRDLDSAESTLMNLTHNSNAVFVELYEDLIWRIGEARGTGPTAAPIADRRAAAYCDVATGLCYSKNLAQWSDELLWRRRQAAALWSSYDGVDYPALADPFATSYEVTLSSNGIFPAIYEYIDPASCDPSRVFTAEPPSGPGALGIILVMPAWL
jgi:hypothetical protein